MGSIQRVCWIFFFFSYFVATSQKIALVLSGGGSKGLAHIGVIRALEENGIPVHCIVGTSMGGTVGAFYASGYNSHQMDSIAKTKEFAEWLNGTVPSKYDRFYQKKEASPAFLTLRINFDHFKPKISSYLINDANLNLALNEMLAGPTFSSKSNFDSLPIPFRCMASDIFTQNQVVIRSGSLADAVRATSSVPLAYKPIRVEGKFLYDGGIYNNFPVDVAMKEFQPDIVIGVNVSAKNFREYPASIDEKLVDESIYHLILSKSDTSYVDSGNGVLISPSLEDYSAMSFSKIPEIIEIGYKAAKLKMDEIKKMISNYQSSNSVKNNNLEKRLESKREVFTSVKPYISTLEVVGTTPEQKKYVKRVLTYKNGLPTPINHFRKGYFRLVNDEHFVLEYPSLTVNSEDSTLKAVLRMQKERRVFFDLGGSLGSRDMNQIYTGIQWNAINVIGVKLFANANLGTFYSNAKVKSKISFPTKHPLELEMDVNYTSYNYFRSANFLTVDKVNSFARQIDRKYGVQISTPFFTKDKLSAYATYFSATDNYYNVDIINYFDTTDQSNYEGWRFGANYTLNTLDNIMYPSKGQHISIMTSFYSFLEKHDPGSTSDLFTNSVTKREYFSIGGTFNNYIRFHKFKLGFNAAGAVSQMPLLSNYTSTMLNLPSYYPHTDSRTLILAKYRAFSFVAFGVEPILEVRKNTEIRYQLNIFSPLVGLRKNVGGSGEFGFNETYGSLFIPSSSLALVYHTKIGPIAVSGNYYDENKRRFGLFVHAGFLIFQPKTLER